MTPMELVLSRFTLPFEPYPYQTEVVNALAPKPKQGHYLAVGVGKTMTSTCSTLYKFAMGEADKAIVLLPPILMKQWKRWIESISGCSAMMYRGTPKQRKKMKFDTNFILMTYQIFKRDFERLAEELDEERTVLVCDEATAIKNIESDNYKFVRTFSMYGHLMLLTGTPLSKPEDAYAYIKLLSPETYRNYNQFMNLHVEELDFFDKPKSYVNLDVLHENMKINTVRILKEDVLDQLPEVTYTPLHYELSDDHMALYRKLAEEQMLEYEDGSKLDATQTTRLWHCMQQLVMNYGYFADDPSLRSTAYDLIDQTMEEVGDRKLIIFTNYRITSASVLEYCQKWGAVAVYGDVSGKQQEKNVERFMTDPTCQILVAQVRSGGYGLNPQEVCSDVLFLEEPLIPIDFEQACGRVYRNGQKNRVQIRVAVAEGTIQVHLHELLMNKDELVNKVVRSYKDIRDALYGKPLPSSTPIEEAA